MKDFMRRIKADYLISSILTILVGLIFIIWPGAVNDTIGTIVAVSLIVIGALYLLGFLIGFMTNGISAAMGVMVLVVGVVLLINPSVIGVILPCLIGVIILVHGIRGIRESVACKKFGYTNWSAGLVMAIICVLFGALCVVGAVFGKFGVVDWPYILIGIALVYNGISNLWISIMASGAERKYNKKMAEVNATFVEDQQAGTAASEQDKNETDGI